MRKFLIGATVVMSAVLVLTAAPAYAKSASITVSPTTVSAGGTVHISGSIPVNKCPASDGATVTGEAALFPPDGFGPTATRDAHGNFAVDYTVPTSTPAGTYDVGLRCGGGNVGVSASLTVTSPVGGPATGAGGTAHGSSLWTAFGIACLLLAAAAVVWGRRLARRAP
jgi:hypothetical protein